MSRIAIFALVCFFAGASSSHLHSTLLHRPLLRNFGYLPTPTLTRHFVPTLTKTVTSPLLVRKVEFPQVHSVSEFNVEVAHPEVRLLERTKEYGLPTVSVPTFLDKPTTVYGVPVKPAGDYGLPLLKVPEHVYGVPEIIETPKTEYGVPALRVPATTYGVPAESFVI